MSGTYRLHCGCKVEREAERIVEFCDAHGAQYREIHERATRDHASEAAARILDGSVHS